MPVALLRVAGVALLANKAAMRAHIRVKITQRLSIKISGVSPNEKCYMAPVSAVNVIMRTLVPTAVFSS